MPATFATAITCIDRRVHAPLTEWIRQRFGADVDLITDPGADAACARGERGYLDGILARVAVHGAWGDAHGDVTTTAHQMSPAH